jgi:hypothetical protein
LVLELVLAAVFDVMIAEDRMEVDAIGDKCRERLFEIFRKVASAAVGINVVASGYDESNGERWWVLTICCAIAS